jgi:hypothetical protein
MSRRILWFLIPVVFVAGILLWWFTRSPEPPPPATGFAASEVAIDSPEIKLELTDARGVVSGDVMRWTCSFVCREPEGCHADLAVTVNYSAGGTARSIGIGGTIDVGSGDPWSVSVVQRPPDQVDTVDLVEVVVRHSYGQGAPTPIAFQ